MEKRTNQRRTTNKRNMSEDAKRAVLPNSEKGLELKNQKKDADRFAKMMQAKYDVANFWDAMGMIYCESYDEYKINPESKYPFKFKVVYGNVNKSLKVYFVFSKENEFIWLYKKGLDVEHAATLVKLIGLDNPSVEQMREKFGDDVFDEVEEYLPKEEIGAEGNETEEQPSNVVKIRSRNESKEMKNVVRLNESQFNNLVKKIVKESVKKILKEEEYDDITEYNNASDYSDLIEWIRENVEDYVTYDDTKIMPSMRAGFNTDGFIRNLIKFLDGTNF